MITTLNDLVHFSFPIPSHPLLRVGSNYLPRRVKLTFHPSCPPSVLRSLIFRFPLWSQVP
jgi:hypothetical protein